MKISKRKAKKMFLIDGDGSIIGLNYKHAISYSHVTIPKEINGMKITKIDNSAFWYRTHLKSVTIPNTITSIGHSVFFKCDNLRNINYTGTKEQWEAIDNNDTSIELLNINVNYEYRGRLNDLIKRFLKELKNIYTNISISKNKYFKIDRRGRITGLTQLGKSLKFIEIPNDINGKPVNGIKSGAFKDCINLESVSISEDVKYIEFDAFRNCINLKSITIPNSVKYISDAVFDGCKILTDIKFPKYVKNIEAYTYNDCEMLNEFTVPEGVEMIGFHAFTNCISLISIIISNTVNTIDIAAFYNCPNLATIYYTGTEEEWDNIDIGILNDSLKFANIVYNYKCDE